MCVVSHAMCVRITQQICAIIKVMWCVNVFSVIVCLLVYLSNGHVYAAVTGITCVIHAALYATHVHACMNSVCCVSCY